MTIQIFLSYRGVDKPLKDQLVEVLTTELVDFYAQKEVDIKFWDMETDCVGDWGEASVRALKESRIMIPIITDAYLSDDQPIVREEARIARQSYGDKRINVVPLKVTDKPLDDELELFLGGYSAQWSTRGRDQESFEKVAHKCKLLLDAIICGNQIVQTSVPTLKTNPARSNPYFFGREEELRLLDESFKKSNVVLLSGQGGLGKTAIARQYIALHKEEYKCHTLLTVQKNVRSSIISLSFEGAPKEFKSEDARFEYNWSQLSKLSKQTIIVLDNYDDGIEDDTEMLRRICEELNCRFLITSRGRQEGLITVEVKGMPFANLKELVLTHYPSIGRDNRLSQNELDSKLKEVFNLFDNHTLLIEVASKVMRFGAVSIDEILEKNAFFENDEKVYLERFDKKQTINDHLSSLFDLTSLNQNQITILQILCLIGIDGIEKRDLKRIASLKNLNDYNHLVDVGFIVDDDGVCHLHKMISEHVYHNHRPTVEQVEIISSWLFEMANIDKLGGEFFDANAVTNNLQFFVNQRSEGLDQAKQMDLLELSAILHNALGIFEVAIDLQRQVLSKRLAFYGNDTPHTEVARAYMHLGSFWMTLNMDVALKYLGQALEIEEAATEDDLSKSILPDVHCLIGTAHFFRNHEKSAYHLEKAYELQQKKSKNSPSVITAEYFNILGVNNINIGDYHKAIEMFEKAIEVLTEHYRDNPNHPHIANEYVNISTSYTSLFEQTAESEYFKKSINVLTKAMDVYVNCYKDNPNHPSIAMTHVNVGRVYLIALKFDSFLEHALDYSLKVIEHYEKALSIFNACYKNNPNHPMIAMALSQIGIAYLNMSFIEEKEYRADKYYKKAMDCFDEAIEKCDMNVSGVTCANVYTSVANIYQKIADVDEDAEYRKKAAELYVKSAKTQEKSVENTYDKMVLSNYCSAGLEYDKLGDEKTAFDLCVKAFELGYVIFKGDTSNDELLTLFDNVKTLFKKMDHKKPAFELYEQMLGIYRKFFGEKFENPLIVNLLNKILQAGREMSFASRDEEDLAFYEMKLSFMKAYYFGKDNIDVADTYYSLAKTHKDLKNFDKAIENFNLALGIYKNIDRIITKRMVCKVYTTLGDVYLAQSKNVSALENYGKALFVSEACYGKNNSTSAHLCICMGDCYLALDDCESALERYKDAFEMYQASPPSRKVPVATVYDKIGGLFLKNQDFNKAFEYFNKVYDTCVSEDSPIFKRHYSEFYHSYGSKAPEYIKDGKVCVGLDFYILTVKLRLQQGKDQNDQYMNWIYNTVTNLFNQTEKKGASLDVFHKILEFREVYYSDQPNHTNIANVYETIGGIYYSEEDYVKALEYQLKSLDMRLAYFKDEPRHPSIIRNYSNVAMDYEALGDKENCSKYRALAEN